MDAGTTLKHIAPFLIPILALSIPIVAIIWSYRSRMHQSTLLHETIRHLSDHGHPIPQSFLDQLKRLWAIGVIPLFIGIGLVFVARTESRSRLNAVSPRSKNQDGDS